MELYSNQMRTEDFNIKQGRSHNKNSKTYRSKKLYNETILTFDIEVSSAWLENGKVIPYRKGESADYWNSLQPLSLCYIWQFSCNGKVYYGRELRDFLKVLDDLPPADTVIWVHNLSYEFAFLSNILTWASVFARSPHKPMKCIPKEYPHIEFRCSYILTRLSLEAWGKQLGIHKKVGDLDYDVLRTPLSQLDDKELGYCEYDCLIVEKGIKTYLDKYGSMREIPLTQTGTVRKEVKDRLTKNPDYVKKLKKLIPHTLNEYSMLKDEIFAGGYTHANMKWSGQVIDSLVEHYDFCSSYPTCMVCEKYPMTRWLLTSTTINKSLFDDYAFIYKLSFTNIHSKSYNTYIQRSKCRNLVNAKYDNGRILQADMLDITVTEQDYLTIEENYEWDSVKVTEAYKSRKEYLPKEFVEYILELYSNKTKYKGVEGYEEIYMQSKQYINSLFGMSVTAIVQADIVLNGDEWYQVPMTKEYVEDKFEKLRSWNPREKRYFLSYSWGCWVTAYARRNLWKCIHSIDEDVIYCDTDSIFCFAGHNFDWYNEEITDKLRKACEAMNIDFELTRPSTPKGEQKPLGIFDKEDDCTEFITLGAKRYCERRTDGKLHLTISGINKGAVDLLEDNIYNFRDKFEFDKDADCVNKKLCTYITEQPTVTFPDGYVCTYTHGINLRRTGYVLGLTEEYADLINYDLKIVDIPEQYFTRSRANWIVEST